VVPPRNAGRRRGIVHNFDAVAPSFYDDQDAERGFIEIRTRTRHKRPHPVMTVSFGIATTDTRRYNSPQDAVAVATELKALQASAHIVLAHRPAGRNVNARMQEAPWTSPFSSTGAHSLGRWAR
jgi:hypothetical protein